MVGYGSDTTQDVMNALAGFVPTATGGNFFEPAASSAATGKRQLISWDAFGSTCITPKPGFTSIVRPNGSTNGRRVLSRKIDGGNWPVSTTSCGGPKPGAAIPADFARSSSGVAPGGTGPLTYIPFGRDALSFGYWAEPGVTPVTNLTTAQLTALHSTGPITIGTVTIYACEIQNGSGTYGTWRDKLSVTDAQIDAATTACTPTDADDVQENHGLQLQARGQAVANNNPTQDVQVVVGFSAANFISQTNGKVTSQLPSPAGTVDLGTIDGLPKAYDGPVAGPVTPNSTFYGNATWGRDVYNVLSTALLANAGNSDIKSMFVGPNSGVCSKASVIAEFGFPAPVLNPCGDTTLQGPLVA
ncbi:MAG TPA: hypothetical protein VFV32_03100 [Acidimicrobiales bacterium]|nr:hypothetical protein [Acidimicrobiales bacterium]